MTLLVFLLTFSLSAQYLINDHLISPKAGDVIEKIGQELTQKTGLNAYVIASNDVLDKRGNLYEYVKKYEKELNEPWVAILFLPNNKRLGILVSDPSLKKAYDPSEVKKYAIDILGSADSNSVQSKYDVAMVQAYSELADELAASKGVKLKNTIKDQGRWIIKVITWLVYLGAVLVFWVYFGRPLYMRIRHGKQ
ncbi:hypothetical protein [Nitratifractor salsuginis]|uniref:hypothetical protein n=1 Tax=Nitratifractor salsuginis TaxID=269261 RepID=UPI0011D07256|nr:hypothetical protein [Nitratifractor salsuginis]